MPFDHLHAGGEPVVDPLPNEDSDLEEDRIVQIASRTAGAGEGAMAWYRDFMENWPEGSSLHMVWSSSFSKAGSCSAIQSSKSCHEAFSAVAERSSQRQVP